MPLHILATLVSAMLKRSKYQRDRLFVSLLHGQLRSPDLQLSSVWPTNFPIPWYNSGVFEVASTVHHIRGWVSATSRLSCSWCLLGYTDAAASSTSYEGVTVGEPDRACAAVAFIRGPSLLTRRSPTRVRNISMGSADVQSGLHGLPSIGSKRTYKRKHPFPGCMPLIVGVFLQWS